MKRDRGQSDSNYRTLESKSSPPEKLQKLLSNAQKIFKDGLNPSLFGDSARLQNVQTEGSRPKRTKLFFSLAEEDRGSFHDPLRTTKKVDKVED
jgi:hypothetical protein